MPRSWQMPTERRGRGPKDWRLRPRPTVTDLERSDEIIADFALAITALALCLGVPNLAALIYQAAIL